MKSACAQIAPTDAAKPPATATEDPTSMLRRIYDQEYKERYQTASTAPESAFVKPGEWVEQSGVSEANLRYAVRCLVDEAQPIAYLSTRADVYIARRNQDDFSSSRVFLVSDRDPVEDLEPGVSRLPPGYEWSPDMKTMRKCKPGSPLPPGWKWGADEMPHPPVDVVPWKPPVAAPQAPKEKHLVTMDPEKIAKAKAQLVEIAKRDVDAKAAAASPAPEAKT